jgi:hypothetical protein
MTTTRVDDEGDGSVDILDMGGGGICARRDLGHEVAYEIYRGCEEVQKPNRIEALTTMRYNTIGIARGFHMCLTFTRGSADSVGNHLVYPHFLSSTRGKRLCAI